MQNTDIFQKFLHLITLFNLYILLRGKWSWHNSILLVADRIVVNFAFVLLGFKFILLFLLRFTLTLVSSIFFFLLNWTFCYFSTLLCSDGCFYCAILNFLTFLFIIFIRSVDLLYKLLVFIQVPFLNSGIVSWK